MDSERDTRIKSVAIIGAGAAGEDGAIAERKNVRYYMFEFSTNIALLGAVTAAAFKAENYFEHIRVFERRETPGGTW